MTPRRECSDEVITASNAGRPPNCPFTDCHESRREFGNSALIIGGAIEKVSRQPPRLEGADMFHAIADRPVSEERPAWRTRLTHSVSSPISKNVVREQIACIPALVEDAVVCHFEDLRTATESSLEMKVIYVF